MHKISICAVSQSFHPYLGGLTKYVNALGKELIKNGHEFRVIHLKTPSIGSIDFHDGVELIRTGISELSDEEMEGYGNFKEIILRVTHGEKVKKIFFPSKDTQNYKSYIKLNEKMGERICEVYEHKPFDMLHIHDFQLMPLASMLKGKLTTPMVFTWHIPFTMDIAEEWRNFFVNYMRYYNRVIFSTDEYTDAAVMSGLEGSKVRRIYPFIDLDGYSYEGKNDARKKLRISKNEILVLCVSRIDPRKGQDVLINAMKTVAGKNKKVKCVFVGNGSFSKQMIKTRSVWHNRLLRLVKSLRLASRVQFTGYLEDEELHKLYEASDIVVQPSKDEGFGLTVSEAMLFGKPVIGSRTGGIPVQIKQGYNGFLFEPYNYDELASFILMLAGDKKLMEEMGKNGMHEVREKFSSERGYKEHMEIYSELLSGPSR
jgi:glycosyltransferase involved in cell wall biosynthesis